MIITVILIAVYLLSVVLSWWASRLHSSKYWDIWLDDDCSFEIWWVIPLINTISSLIIFTLGFIYSRTKNTKSKWLNTDL